MPKEDTQFKPGQSGNPKGKPKGYISLKKRVQEYWQANPEAHNKVVERVATDPKFHDLTWKMLEGMPQQKTEVDATVHTNMVDIIKHATSNTEGSGTVPDESSK